MRILKILSTSRLTIPLSQVPDNEAAAEEAAAAPEEPAAEEPVKEAVVEEANADSNVVVEAKTETVTENNTAEVGFVNIQF